MEELPIGHETQNFIETATDRELKIEIYCTLRKIEIRQEQTVSKLSIIAGVAIFYLVCSLLAALYWFKVTNI